MSQSNRKQGGGDDFFNIGGEAAPDSGDGLEDHAPHIDKTQPERGEEVSVLESNRPSALTWPRKLAVLALGFSLGGGGVYAGIDFVRGRLRDIQPDPTNKPDTPAVPSSNVSPSLSASTLPTTAVPSPKTVTCTFNINPQYRLAAQCSSDLSADKKALQTFGVYGEKNLKEARVVLSDGTVCTGLIPKPVKAPGSEQILSCQ